MAAIAGTAAAVAGTVGAATSIGSSIYGMVSGSEEAGSASDAQQSSTKNAELIAAKQVDIAQQQQDIAQAQWDRYLATFAPLEDAMVSEAQASPTDARSDSGFLSTMGTINRNYANTGANIRSMMGGKNPYGSGVAYGAQRSNELNRVRDVAKAETSYDQKLDEQRWNRLSTMANLGRGLSGGASSSYGSASSSLGNAASTYGNAASSYGNLASMYGNLSGSSGSSLGSSLGNLYQMYALSQTPKTTTTDTSWYDPSWTTARITG